MNAAQVTKIVSACLILAACHNREHRPSDGVGETSQPGIGVQTKAGKMITQGKWCQPLKTDANGVVTQESYQFRRDGSFRRSLMVLNQNSTLTKTKDEKGNWAILDGQLLFILDGNTLKMNVSESVRESDKVTCLKVTADSTDVAGEIPFCPCD